MFHRTKPADAESATHLQEGDRIVFTTRDGECSWNGTVLKAKENKCLVKSVGFRKWVCISEVLWKENRNQEVAQ